MSGPSSYYCVFRLLIRGGFTSRTSGDVWLLKAVYLPFPPSVDHIYSLGDWQAQPKEIIYNIKTGVFYCYPESDDAYDRNGPTMEEIVSAHMAKGWERDKNDDC